MAASKKELVALYEIEMLSIPQIATLLGLNYSATRKLLLDIGVKMRTRGQGIRLRTDVLGKHLLGKKRLFNQAWRDNMKVSAQKRGERDAKGTSRKASGYVQITRGPNKGRGQHVVIMEKRLGRRLLPDEIVHHIDENRSNNKDNNLALVTRSGHTRLHRREQRLRKGKMT